MRQFMACLVALPFYVMTWLCWKLVGVFTVSAASLMLLGFDRGTKQHRDAKTALATGLGTIRGDLNG